MKSFLVTTFCLPILLLLVACGSSQTQQPVLRQPTAPSQPMAPPQATARPEPTVRTRPTVENRRVSPDQLLAIVNWGGWGAGGSKNDCGDGIPNIYIYPHDGGEPVQETYYSSYGGVVGMRFEVNGCDYPPKEEVDITFILPDGTNDSTKTYANERGGWIAPWLSVPGEPLGKYTVQARSNSGTASDTFSIASASHPLMTISCIEDFPKGNLVLTGFRPNEEVLMGEYGGSDEDFVLLDHWYEQVGSDGTLITTYKRPSDRLLVVIGQDTVTKILNKRGGVSMNMKVSAYDYLLHWGC